jgi:hypothetical protein
MMEETIFEVIDAVVFLNSFGVVVLPSHDTTYATVATFINTAPLVM